MGINDIAFPNLGIYLHDVPKSFSIAGFTIALYGVVIAIGMMLGVAIAVYDRRSRGLNEDPIWDVALIGIPSGIVGARIYYVIFAWARYLRRGDRCPYFHFHILQGKKRELL